MENLRVVPSSGVQFGHARPSTVRQDVLQKALRLGNASRWKTTVRLDVRSVAGTSAPALDQKVVQRLAPPVFLQHFLQVRRLQAAARGTGLDLPRDLPLHGDSAASGE